MRDLITNSHSISVKFVPMATNEKDMEETNTPAAHQHPKKLSRASSWDRVVVYDADSGNVAIHKKRDVDKSTETSSNSQKCANEFR
jgi:hypothetical protein